MLQRNPLSSLPPETTSDASTGLQAAANTSSVPKISVAAINICDFQCKGTLEAHDTRDDKLHGVSNL
jgi:hypothetical protein